jgi:hypothetical protein
MRNPLEEAVSRGINKQIQYQGRKKFWKVVRERRAKKKAEKEVEPEYWEA